MIQLNPENMIRIELTPKEHKTVLTHCQNINRDMYDRIQNAHNGVIHLITDECYDIQNSLYVAIEQTNDGEVKDVLGQVFNKLNQNPQSGPEV